MTFTDQTRIERCLDNIEVLDPDQQEFVLILSEHPKRVLLEPHVSDQLGVIYMLMRKQVGEF